MLKQLPDGNWIDPEYVVMVTVLSKTPLAPDRVVIRMREENVHVIECTGYENAQMARDMIMEILQPAKERVKEGIPPRRAGGII